MKNEPKNIEFSELEDVNNETSKQGVLNGNVDLIGHVGVQLTANVGHIDLSVEELFCLDKGTVLKMVQTVDEPLTLLVNNKAVAKASLVAVGDNFGVQVVDIIK